MKPGLEYTPPTRSMAHPGQAKADLESSQALVNAVLNVVAVLQLKARSSPVHSAVDWLYPNMAAVAALEQALLQPSHTLTWTSNLHNQASRLYYSQDTLLDHVPFACMLTGVESHPHVARYQDCRLRMGGGGGVSVQ